jgi:hypothetical protein
LVDRVTLSFDYVFDSSTPHSVELDGDLSARLEAANGFVRTLELPTQERASGDELELRAPLDLVALKRLVHDVERSTGVEQGLYELRITPEVSVQGSVSDRPFTDSFAPAMTLRFDGLQLLAPRDVTGAVPDEVIQPVQTGDIRVARIVPGYLSAMGHQLSLPLAQQIGAIGAAASLAALFMAAIALMFVLPRDEASRIYARYGSMLVPVEEMPVADHDTIDVPRMATLVKLGQRFEEPILHHTSRQSHSYMVFHDGLLYRYRLVLTMERAA